MGIKDFSWSNEVVLIADDDVYSSLLIEKMISKTGAKVLVARNGKEALDILMNETKVSVAIIDMIMPKLNGYQVVAKSRAVCPDTIFIAYTADILRLNKMRCDELGFYKVVAKPILPIRFLKMLDEALALRGQFS